MYIYIITGKISITTATQKLHQTFQRFFPFIFSIDFGNFTSYFAALHRLKPINDADFFPGTIYTTYIYVLTPCINTRFFCTT